MIRPVEMQMLLPRTESVGNTQHNENQRPVNENAFAASEVAREVKHNSETVISKDDSKLKEYQYDASEEGNGTYKNPKKRKKKNSKTEDEKLKDVPEEEAAAPDRQPRVNIQI